MMHPPPKPVAGMMALMNLARHSIWKARNSHYSSLRELLSAPFNAVRVIVAGRPNLGREFPSRFILVREMTCILD